MVDFLPIEPKISDIWVMVDVVANHMGPVGYNYTSLVPFNDQSDFHGCYTYCTNCNIKFFLSLVYLSLCLA